LIEWSASPVFFHHFRKNGGNFTSVKNLPLPLPIVTVSNLLFIGLQPQENQKWNETRQDNTIIKQASFLGDSVHTIPIGWPGYLGQRLNVFQRGTHCPIFIIWSWRKAPN